MHISKVSPPVLPNVDTFLGRSQSVFIEQLAGSEYNTKGNGFPASDITIFLAEQDASSQEALFQRMIQLPKVINDGVPDEDLIRDMLLRQGGDMVEVERRVNYVVEHLKQKATVDFETRPVSETDSVTTSTGSNSSES